jgi:hypothetical protein
MEVFHRERQTPEALDALVKADAKRFWPIMKEAGIKPERSKTLSEIAELQAFVSAHLRE